MAESAWDMGLIRLAAACGRSREPRPAINGEIHGDYELEQTPPLLLIGSARDLTDVNFATAQTA